MSKRIATFAEIVSLLVKAEREGLLRERIHLFCRAALPIVDEIGHLPVIPGAAISSSSSSTPAIAFDGVGFDARAR